MVKRTTTILDTFLNKIVITIKRKQRKKGLQKNKTRKLKAEAVFFSNKETLTTTSRTTTTKKKR